MRPALIAALLAALCATTFAGADETAIRGVGGAIEPMKEHPSIVMERMEVGIDLWPTHAAVDCRFRFRNAGPATVVRMGFPESAAYQPYARHPVGFARFATWVDGARYRTRTEGLKWDETRSWWQRWRVKRVQFASGQTRSVRVRYEAPLGRTGGLPAGVFEYDITSGASWRGPIGFAHVRLRGHYDPDRGWLDVRGGLKRTGATTWAWTERSYQPRTGGSDDITVNYLPGYFGIWARGYSMEWEISPPYPYLRGGRSWTQAVLLALLLNAEMRGEKGQVTFVRGGRVVSLGAGDPWLYANGRRYGLGKAAAPRIEAGRLMVPLAAVSRALGATVAFDTQTRETHITFADEEYIKAALNYKTDPGIEFNLLPEGYAPPELSAYDPTVRSGFVDQKSGEPWICLGDFDGDGMQEAAVALQKGSSWGIGIVRYEREWKNTLEFEWLPGYPEVRAQRDAIPTTLRTRPPGVVESWQDGSKSRRLELKRDGIELVGEKAAVMYYWDEAQKGYAVVQTVD